MTEIGLGTVQLGVPYGNQAKRSLMSRTEAFAILELALNSGIRFFDTASSYGKSEERLGDYGLGADGVGAVVSTKVPIVDAAVWSSYQAYKSFVGDILERSRARLKVEKFGLLQFHQCELPFLSAVSVRRVMAELVDEGVCEAIGISLYQPDEVEHALSIPTVSTLQIPLNVIDRRFVSEPLRKCYRAKSVRVIARSVLFQGVLVPTAPLPPVTMQDGLRELRRLACEAAQGEDLVALALAFVLANCGDIVDIALLGVDTPASLSDLLARTSTRLPPVSAKTLERFDAVFTYAAQNSLLNPARWNQPI